MKVIYQLLILVLVAHAAQAQGADERILTKGDADSRYGSYSPDGQYILFESDRAGQWDIYLMDSDGNNQTRLTQSDSADRRPSWHPDGVAILFESNRYGKNELFSLTIADSRLSIIDIDLGAGEPIFARYSPDASYIAFANSQSDQRGEIVLATSDGTVVRNLTNFGFRSFYPSWSPDGQSVVFFSRHETDNTDDEIYTIGINGQNKRRLTNWPKHNFCPSWSNAGDRIAYVTSMEDSRPEVYIMDTNGGDVQRITFNEDGDTLPQWSPDDSRLLFTGYRDGHYQICELILPD